MATQTGHILVGGGTGLVGRHLVRLLKSGGAKVRVITRKPSSSDQEHISWTKIRQEGLPIETTAVVNLAGRNILEPGLWTDSYKREVYDSRIETNRLLATAIEKSPSNIKAFVSVSGVGYYKPSETFEYDESWTQPEEKNYERDYLMSLARDWEKAGELDEEKAPTTRRVVIRPGVVIGRGGGIINNLILPFSLGLGGPLGDGKQWFPWIHVEDLASMFKFAITNDHVTGVINGVAPEQVRNKDFASTLGKVLKRPAFIPMPSFVVKTMFGSERATILLNGQRVKSRAGLLGFRYQYPNLLEACGESVK